MEKWSAYPFIRFLIFFSAGITAYLYKEALPGLVVHGFLCALILYLFLHFFFRKNFSYAVSPLLGFTGCCFLLSAGYIAAYLSDEANHKDHLLKKKDFTNYSGLVISDPEEKEKYIKAELLVRKIYRKGQSEKAEGRVLIFIPKEPGLNLRYGDHLLLKEKPEEVPPTMFSGFDYKKYLRNKHIYHRHYVRKGAFTVTGYEPRSRIMVAAITMRKKCETVLRSALSSENEFKIATALILGMKSHLDIATREAYARAGAMHILAVSGLHISIICQMLLLFTGKLSSNRKTAWLPALLMLAVLWFYAFLTGLSPSVFRATLMFSFLLAAKVLRRNTNTLNTIALCAFILLCYHPFYLTDAGFQLSFLAVWGIVYLYPKIYHQAEFGHPLADKIWGITCVSLAAQLSTFPLTLFYFNQFPTWFLLSNLLVIPLVVVILYCGMLTIFLSWAGPMFDLSARILQGMIFLLNKSVFMFEKFPYPVITGITLSIFQTWTIYGALGILLLLFHQRKIKYAWMLLIIVSVFSLSRMWGY